MPTTKLLPGQIALIATLILLGSPEISQAQLFGDRGVGRPLSRQPGPPRLEGVGQITGSERFIRDNRGRQAFVGSDQRDVSDFVGSEQGRTGGAVLSATAGLQENNNRSSRINQPLRQAAAGQMYQPRLVTAFVTPNRDSDQMLSRLREELSEAKLANVAVSVARRTAILRGEVASESEADLVELLLLFEPGIDEVQNLLQIAPPLPPAPVAPIPIPSR